MSESQKDLEKELWSVYGQLPVLVEEGGERAKLLLHALELIAKIRSQGEKVKPSDATTADSALQAARAAANGVRK